MGWVRGNRAGASHNNTRLSYPAFIPSQYSAEWGIAQILFGDCGYWLGAINADSHIHPGICRGRFIAPIADLSALGACSDGRMKKLKCMGIVAVVALVAVVSFVSVVAQVPGATVCYNSVNKFINYQRR